MELWMSPLVSKLVETKNGFLNRSVHHASTPFTCIDLLGYISFPWYNGSGISPLRRQLVKEEGILSSLSVGKDKTTGKEMISSKEVRAAGRYEVRSINRSIHPRQGILVASNNTASGDSFGTGAYFSCFLPQGWQQVNKNALLCKSIDELFEKGRDEVQQSVLGGLMQQTKSCNIPPGFTLKTLVDILISQASTINSVKPPLGQANRLLLNSFIAESKIQSAISASSPSSCLSSASLVGGSTVTMGLQMGPSQWWSKIQSAISASSPSSCLSSASLVGGSTVTMGLQMGPSQ
ncbi:unnamed protein product [Ilex paraguariensis]|uniref:Uncharacterized protein n=1 Tax=Ilex paraguariensis TaxID=185542 RepID=A0ABC8U506_9AQUA